MAWIFTIARNLAYMELRRRGSHPETNLDDLGETIPAKEELSGLIDRLVLQKTLQSLGDKERQIVLLHAVSGLKFREVADVVEMPLGSVLSGYSRAMKKLKKILNEEG